MAVRGLRIGIGVMNLPWELQVRASNLGGGMLTMKMRKKKISCSSMKVGVGMGRRGGEVDAAVRLCDMWRDYQGSNHWDGLLDPMDDNLRSEILRYGDFVDAAYVSFDFDTMSSGYATCKFSRNSMLSECGLGGRGYTTTRYLKATSGVRLPRWVDDRAPGWMSTRSGWIGYVAVCNDKDEISRLGRRDVVIAYRGTATCLEWVENVRATLTSLDGEVGPNDNSSPMVESGFWSLYTSKASACDRSLRESVKEEMKRIMQTYGDEPLSVTVVGHSLGAALATLTAYDITATAASDCGGGPPPLVTVFSFGGPRVGNRSFRSELSKNGAKVLRIVNSDDFITKVPGIVIDNNDVAVHLADSGLPGWIQKRVEDTRWAYADVGRELRLSSRVSPYLNNPDIATCHDLKTYLHLVDGFVSSTCPFRSTANRLLAKT